MAGLKDTKEHGVGCIKLSTWKRKWGGNMTNRDKAVRALNRRRASKRRRFTSFKIIKNELKYLDNENTTFREH